MPGVRQKNRQAETQDARGGLQGDASKPAHSQAGWIQLEAVPWSGRESKRDDVMECKYGLAL